MIWQQLLIWVVTFILTDYFRERLPSQTASGLGDFNIPTATEGRPVPICTGGTVRFDAPNCIWYGDFVAEDRTVETGVIFKRDETIGFTYFLALQYALYLGESAGITGVWIGDDRVFDHVADAGGIPQPFVDIIRDDLFGGVDNGGGFEGRIRLHDGSETQAVSAFLNSRLDPLPAYRGLSYIMVTDIAEAGGANIGESNQLRYIRVELQTFDDLAGTAGNAGLGNTLALAGDTHFIGPDLNPIVTAWDLWTNTRWGRGFGLSDVDISSFQDAAATIYAEGIGWTNIQDEQTTTGQIQDLIEQHIDGYIGPNPLTGLIEVNLARPDYSIPALFNVTDTGIAANLLEVKSWDQGDWSQTKNRIRIRYTSRSKDWKETHAVETAAGNRIIQGITRTEEIRYPGVHTDAVAQAIAAREKRGLSLPLQKGKLVVDRTAWELRPGVPFRLNSVQASATDLPVRVTRVQLGDQVRQQIELDVVEDIFGPETTTVEDNPPSDFVPPIQTVIPFATDDQAAFEAPFILMRADVAPNSVPRIATLARSGPGNSPTEYEVVRRTGNPPAGAYTSTDFVREAFCTVGTLRNAENGAQSGNGGLSIQIDPIGGESLDGLINTYGPARGNWAGVAVISPGLATEEWVAFDEIVDDLTGIRLENVYRACQDTFWKEHTAGERVWFVWTGGLGMGSETYTAGLGVEIKLLPRSPNDEVLEAAATALPVVNIDGSPSYREDKPLLPAIVAFEEGIWPSSDIDFDQLVSPTAGGDYIGNRLIPQHRLWRTQDIIWSVQGLDISGGGLNPSDLSNENLDVSIWIHDLDADPSANRANAVFNISNQVVVTATDEIQIPKADMITGGAVGLGFNARLEIETRHSPTGATANQLSHDAGTFDFFAVGAFTFNNLTVEPTAIFHFDGADLDTETDDASAINTFIEFNGSAEIDTALSVFGGSALILDGVDSFVRCMMDRRFLVTGDWTVECRLNFLNDPPAAAAIFDQIDYNGYNSFGVEYEPASNFFQLAYSTTGSNGPFGVGITNAAFVPTPGTWYAFAVSKKGTTYHVFIDGVRIGTAVTTNPSFYVSSIDFLIGARNFSGATDFFPGNIDEFRVTPFALYTDDYTIAPSMFSDARGLQGLLCHLEGTDTDVTNQTDDLMDYTINATATSEISNTDSKFGSTSLRCDGVNDKTTIESADGSYIEETLTTDPLYQPSGNPFDFKRGDFTIELWFNHSVTPAINNPTEGTGYKLIAKSARPLSAGFDWEFGLNAANTLFFNRSPTGAIASQQSLGAAVTSSNGTWYHAAVVRNGDALEIYFDGNRIAQNLTFFTASSSMWNDDSPSGGPNPVSIGRTYAVNGGANRLGAFNGFIDEVNIEKRAIYNGATYTIPTGPTRPDPKRVIVDVNDRDPLMILDHFEGATSQDWIHREESNIGSRLGFAGSGQISSGNAKFGSSSFLGVGSVDYGVYQMSKVNHHLRDSDFTIDAWIDHDVLPHLDSGGGHSIISQWRGGANQREFAFYLDDQGGGGTTTDLVFAWSVDGTAIKRAFVTNINASIAINTWIHYQVTRDGSTIRLWIDGVEQTLDGASDSIGSDVIHASPASQIFLGYMDDNAPNPRDLDGWMDELRVIRTATAAGNFTPPVAPYADPPSVETNPYA